MTINVKNCANVRAKFFLSQFMRIAVIVIVISTRVVCLKKKDVSYSNSQPRIGTRKTNDGRKFSEIKLQTT